MWIEIIQASLLIAGSFILLLASIGILRFPDVFCRAHALAKAMPFGIGMVLMALWISIGTDASGFKAFLALIFQAMSIPVAGHLIAYIAYKKRVPLWDAEKQKEN